MKCAAEKLKDYIIKQVEKERDKWNSGMSNQFFEWDDLYCQLADDIDKLIRRSK